MDLRRIIAVLFIASGICIIPVSADEVKSFNYPELTTDNAVTVDHLGIVVQPDEKVAEQQPASYGQIHELQLEILQLESRIAALELTTAENTPLLIDLGDNSYFQLPGSMKQINHVVYPYKRCDVPSSFMKRFRRLLTKQTKEADN